MLTFAMEHEIITLIIVLSLIWAIERTITAIANRHKPTIQCPCHENNDEEEE